jgi:hypothetical protein
MSDDGNTRFWLYRHLLQGDLEIEVIAVFVSAPDILVGFSSDSHLVSISLKVSLFC